MPAAIRFTFDTDDFTDIREFFTSRTEKWECRVENSAQISDGNASIYERPHFIGQIRNATIHNYYMQILILLNTQMSIEYLLS